MFGPRLSVLDGAGVVGGGGVGGRVDDAAPLPPVFVGIGYAGAPRMVGLALEEDAPDDRMDGVPSGVLGPPLLVPIVVINRNRMYKVFRFGCLKVNGLRIYLCKQKEVQCITTHA